ncbi:MAG: thiamine phosphate synthase [Hoylesella marshii]|jgi:thiamine phosphate pyrophosphorylase|uniref:thiamine phosphate synthase n=1 Tax=Hoylesella marshii TaxID=189722 RepID=UPI003FA1708E
MKLVIMTSPTFFVEEDKILTALFDEGLDNLHIYKPGTAPTYAERLLSLLPEDYYRKITVHDHYYLKKEYGLAGIHLDRLDEMPPQGYKGHITRSCDDLSLLKETRKKSDYVFLHNIFDSLHDKNIKSSFSAEELVNAARKGIIDKKVYALGGMTIDCIKQMKDLGFGGIVVCGDLWNRFDIHNELNYKEVIRHFDKLRKAVG